MDIRTHNGRVKTRLGAVGVTVLLAATLVGGGPLPANARSHSSGHAVSCATQQLPTAKGQAVRITASLAGVTATLRGTSGHAFAHIPRVLKPRLTVTSPADGATTFRPKPVTDTPGRGLLVLGVNRPGGSLPALCLANFPAGPVALLGVTSAFNQCCFLVDTSAPGVQARSKLQDGLIAPSLRVINGEAAIVTADGGFLARFTDYADSAAPLRVLTVRNGRQRDVTDTYRSKLEREAKRWWTGFEQRPSHGLGYLAAWAADRERLGHDATVWSKLHELDDAGKLTGMAGWPRNQSFIDALKRFLTNQGYRD
jgi:hypothetical protein